MSDAHNAVFPPVEIGAEVRPPTVVTPDPETMFARRARRFRDLAPDHQLAPWLLFLGDLSEAQHVIQAGLPRPLLPAGDAIARSIEFGMPVLPRMPFEPDPAVTETIGRLLDHAAGIAMPDPARAALNRLRGAASTAAAGSPSDTELNTLRSAPELTIRGCIEAVLTDSIPVESIAEHVFIGAALQVHFARAAALLEATRLHFIGDGVCPVCGAPPATSGIVGWGGADRTRFCTCSLCGTRWNAVRVKCLACSSTKGIHYQSIKGLADTIKAECCDECRTFVKIMAEDEDPSLEPIADDVASLGLDLLVLESGYRRAGMNLFLLGT
jgi:FdhE protein